MAAEFDCEGCGGHVFECGASAVPKHQLCATCLWICEFIAPEDIDSVTRHLQPLRRQRVRPR